MDYSFLYLREKRKLLYGNLYLKGANCYVEEI